MKKQQKPQQKPIITTPELCEMTGYSSRQLRNLAKAGLFPPPEHGKYELLPTLKGLFSYQRDQLGKRSDAEKESRARYWVTKEKREAFELAKLEGKYWLKDQVCADIQQIAQHEKAVLMQKLEVELPPKLLGLGVIAMTEIMRNTVDEICKIFHDRTEQFKG